MQRPGDGHATATGATLGGFTTSTNKRDMVKVVAFAPEWAAGFKVGGPRFAYGQGGGLVCFLLRCGCLCGGFVCLLLAL